MFLITEPINIAGTISQYGDCTQFGDLKDYQVHLNSEFANEDGADPDIVAKIRQHLGVLDNTVPILAQNDDYTLLFTPFMLGGLPDTNHMALACKAVIIGYDTVELTRFDILFREDELGLVNNKIVLGPLDISSLYYFLFCWKCNHSRTEPLPSVVLYSDEQHCHECGQHFFTEVESSCQKNEISNPK